MSRIGRKPVPIPANVEVSLSGRTLTVKGPVGTLTLEHHPGVSIEIGTDPAQIVVNRPDDARQSRALHGLTRSLVNNMALGVVTPFEKRLEVVGVGYQASMNGKELSLQVGFANTIKLKIPDGVTCELPSGTLIILKSADKHAVGQFAANIRQVRPPEPYKGKGVRYQGEQIRRKAGKAFAK
ncbi:50S ribosomal protein L6 [Rubinisphaera italica]|uniref:Large ribosomal subunit protein uL6 n=1 Tax=Rubinisphaera italica TaxID=2527969 RepID=A0A5C5XKX1_9PLAN|nr:50S ribosomal protein L6 [Rubinisphaera italica]TWT63081.1 50S ribosomal protein L6 [Rubinisphaera italica]